MFSFKNINIEFFLRLKIEFVQILKNQALKLFNSYLVNMNIFWIDSYKHWFSN